MDLVCIAGCSPDKYWAVVSHVERRARVTCVRRFVAKAAREQERTKMYSGGHNKLAEIIQRTDKIAMPLAVKRCEQVLDADSEHKLDIFHVGRKCAKIAC